jgi:hypothetical protein
LQRRGQFAGRAAELLQQIGAESRVRLADVDGLNEGLVV